MKNAEETKGRVDLELKDLEKTLKNIETARPFEDLTVVCNFDWMVVRRVRRGDSANEVCVFRTKLLLPVQILMRRLLNLFPKVAGVFQATRYVFTGTL